MTDTNLTPYLSSLLEKTGVMAKLYEAKMGQKLPMPQYVQTPQDKVGPEVYSSLKITMLVTLALAFLDTQFPDLAESKGHEFRGEMAMRLACEIYRMLTDGLSIDVLRHILGEPDPYKGPKS